MKTNSKQNRSDAIGFHDKLAPNWSKKYRTGIFKQRLVLWETILRKYVTNEQVWLDAGCGSGDLSVVLLNYNAKVIAIDASKNMINSLQARELNDIPLSNLKASIEDINNLRFLHDDNVDGIVCSSVLEYIHDINSPLSEFHNVLKIGGILIFSLPNKGINVRLIQRFIRKILGLFSIDVFNYLEYSVTQENKRSVKEILKKNSFDLAEVYSFTPISKFYFLKLLAPTMYIYVAKRIN